MKRLALIVFAALTLSACATSGGSAPDAAAIAARICPAVQGVLYAVAASPDVTDATRARLAEAEPYITTACSGAASPASLQALTAQALPLVMKAVTASSLSDSEKQAAIVAVIAAQVLIAEVSP